MKQGAMSASTFFKLNPSAIKVALNQVKGSSPRDSGTEMLVSKSDLWGTVGGGQLEHLAIERARAMLNACEVAATMDVPLGPEIGQCCGGRVEISLNRMSAADKRRFLQKHQTENEEMPHVYVMGAGHVGRALAELLQYLPVKTIIVDQRPDELARCHAMVEKRLSIIPEHEVMNAPPQSAFIVLTHDHALDFLIASTALERGDTCYVGLIGSATKRAKFAAWCRAQCDGLSTDNLICPIGASGSRDKRPSVIAAFVAAEVLAVLTSETAADGPRRAHKQPDLDCHSDGNETRDFGAIPFPFTRRRRPS